MNKTDQFINEMFLSPQATKCVDWPYNIKNGTFPVVVRNGVEISARRLILSRHTGVSIDNPMPVTRTCGNPRCVNPNHMVWGYGRRSEKLNGQEVKDIRAAAAAGTRQADLAQHYGVSKVTISNVVTRKTWKHL